MLKALGEIIMSDAKASYQLVKAYTAKAQVETSNDQLQQEQQSFVDDFALALLENMDTSNVTQH